jgi:predicted RNA-binding protein with PIN domain
VVKRVAALCRARGARATLVFDGGRLRPELATQDLGPLSLRVPEPGEDADTLIRRIVERAERPGEYVVVTSDKALYSYVKTLGASVLRTHEWNAIESRLPRPEQGASEKPEREDDVEGWLRRFQREE